jgi:hypothetical protein
VAKDLPSLILTLGVVRKSLGVFGIMVGLRLYIYIYMYIYICICILIYLY